MADSGIKRFWNAIKPPPAVPRDPYDQSDALTPEQQRRRTMLLVGTAVVLFIGASTWGVFVYLGSAQQRADTAFQEAVRLKAAGDYQDAVDRFTKATDIAPQMTAAYLERGLARVTLQQTDAAAKDLEEALKLDPNLLEAHTALGAIYRQRGDFQRAVTEFTMAIKLGSTVDANYQRGQMYESLGDYQKALADYDEAVSEKPDAPFVYRARAAIRDHLGDEAGAEEDRRKVASIERLNDEASAR